MFQSYQHSPHVGNEVFALPNVFFFSPFTNCWSLLYSWITIVNNRMNVQRSRKRRIIGEIIGIVIVQIYICFLPSSCTQGHLPMPKFGRLPVGNKIRGPGQCKLVPGEWCVLRAWKMRNAGKGLWVVSVCLSLIWSGSYEKSHIGLMCQ